jgi:hypothetical protein
MNAIAVLWFHRGSVGEAQGALQSFSASSNGTDVSSNILLVRDDEIILSPDPTAFTVSTRPLISHEGLLAHAAQYESMYLSLAAAVRGMGASLVPSP